MKKYVLGMLCAVLFCANTIAHADEDYTPEEKAWKFRDGLFHSIHWKFGKMIAAKAKNDKAAFAKHAKDMAYLSTMILEGFELKNSLPEGTLAKKDIWSNWQDFEERTKKFQKNIKNLAESGDISAFDPRKFGGSNCGGCHRKYKEKH